jgi:hypothetical protein
LNAQISVEETQEFYMDMPIRIFIVDDLLLLREGLVSLLAELRSRQKNLRETMLRISGAIQVLQEELDRPSPKDGEPDKNPALGMLPEVSPVILSKNSDR